MSIFVVVCTYTYVSVLSMAIIKISDIAKKAGVSAGTVDRVIHNRGRVSPEKKAMVEKAIEELQYKPNLTARALVSRKQLNICAILPENTKGQYWYSIEQGIDRAVENLDYSNLHCEKIYFDQYSLESFRSAIANLKKKENVNGVILATHFEEEIKALSKYLDDIGVLYVFLDSNIEGCNELAYFGLDAYDSGAMSAELTLNITPSEGKVLLVDFIVKDGDRLTQSVKRSEGFVHYFEKTGQKNRLVYFEFDVNHHDTDLLLDRLFEENPLIKTLVTLNSRSYYLADYLSGRNIKDVKLMGFDLIEKNVEYLKERTITFLISQHPQKQGYSAVEALFNSIILKASVEKLNYMPIDIISVSNIKYYQDI